jgi:hypothetical protein
MPIITVHDPHECVPQDRREAWEIVREHSTVYAPTDSTPLQGFPETQVWFSLERYLAFPQTWDALPNEIKDAIIARDKYGWGKLAVLVYYDDELDEGKALPHPNVSGFNPISGDIENPYTYSSDIGWAWHLLGDVINNGIYSTREAFCGALETFVRIRASYHYHQYAATLPFVRILHELKPEHVARACVAAMGYDLMDMSLKPEYDRRGAWIGAAKTEKE